MQRLVSDDKLTQKAAFEELARLDETSKQALIPPLINHVRQSPGQFSSQKSHQCLKPDGACRYSRDDAIAE